jgi:hypothetical protein
MLRYGKGLVSAFVFVILLGCSGVLLGQVKLVAPDVQVFEGDRQVELLWHDPEPESLTYTHQPFLGTQAFPWKGNAGISSGGFYVGACDWSFDLVVSLLPVGVWEISWREVMDWTTGAQRNRAQIVSDLDTYYNMSDGIVFKFDSAGLFLPDLEGWPHPEPLASGIYRGGQAYPESTVVFTFTCALGGELSASGGSVTFDWESRQGHSDGQGETVQTGSFVVSASGVPVEVYKGLKLTFGDGTYAAGESFELGVRVPLSAGDRFTIVADTFEGYMVLRNSIEDRSDQYKVVSKISKCDSFEFFENSEGQPDPSGERYFLDLGIRENQPGVTENPTEPTVLNGFPYRYAVVTFDMDAAYHQVLSPIDWRLVYPSVPPATSAGHVYVIPNPYVRHAGWETDDSRIAFMNVPEGTVIKIYDVSGGYVNTVYPSAYSYDPDLQQGTVYWNLRNADGTKVVSGIYIYRLESKSGDEIGRFIIVR